MKIVRNLTIYSLLSICFLVFAASETAAQSAKYNQVDKINIVNVTAASPVRDGVANEFTLEIEYTLESADEATIAIGFNLDNSGSYRMVGKKKIQRGTSLITMKAKVTPKDWKEYGDFIVLANISPYPVPRARYTPLAGTEKVIDLEP